MKYRYFWGILLLTLLFKALPAQDLLVYSLDWRELENKKQVAFVSLSDSYPLSEHEDSLAIPSSTKSGNAEYFTLTGAYRARFLAGTHTSESDRVFVYDYSVDSLLTFLVKDLNVVACFEGYGTNKWPLSQDVYQIGFNIPTMYLKGFASYYSHAYVCVGRVNPFVRGQMQALAWKKVTLETLAGNSNTLVDTAYYQLEYTLGQMYQYESRAFRYVVQDLLLQKRLSARRLQVFEIGTQAMVFERILRDHESASPAPLNLMNPDDGDYLGQWTGKLFKNEPPVIFGFEYVSFGCESLMVLKPSEKDIYIRCDNRH